MKRILSTEQSLRALKQRLEPTTTHLFKANSRGAAASRRLSATSFRLPDHRDNRIVIRIPSKAIPNIDPIVQAALCAPASPVEDVSIEIPDSEKNTIDAVSEAIDRYNSNHKNVTVFVQCGYRNVMTSESHNDVSSEQSFDGDVPIEENGRLVALHNLSPGYLESVTKYCSDLKSVNGNTNVVLLAHDPEIQLQKLRDGDIIASSDILTDLFSALENACEREDISSYGVSSNGMSLSSEHPLYLPWETLLASATNAIHHNGNDINAEKSSLSTIQLPINLLERRGLEISQQINNACDKPKSIFNIDMLASRPLTCYPDGGVGSGFPFKLIDYRIEGDSEGGTRWTHEIPEIPFQYTPALNAALGHFDGEDLVLIEHEGERKLTVEEQETLEGCRLLQSMLSDLDLSLLTMRSFEAYQNELVTKVIPMIHNTFEELDEESATVLQVSVFIFEKGMRYLLILLRTNKCVNRIFLQRTDQLLDTRSRVQLVLFSCLVVKAFHRMAFQRI